MWSFITTREKNISKFYTLFIQILAGSLTWSLAKCEFGKTAVTHLSENTLADAWLAWSS